MVVKPSIFVLESTKPDHKGRNRVVILSEQAGWSAKGFQQSNNSFEKRFMNCNFTNDKPDPYFILGFPDHYPHFILGFRHHCARIICNGKEVPTSKIRKKLVLYRNQPFQLN